MIPLNRAQVDELIHEKGKFVAIGVYLDATAEYKTGTASKTGRPFTIKHSVTLVKFGEGDATTCFQELEDEAAVRLFQKSPKPFKLGDRIAVVFTQAYEENFKPAMRVESFHAYTGDLKAGKASA